MLQVDDVGLAAEDLQPPVQVAVLRDGKEVRVAFHLSFYILDHLFLVSFGEPHNCLEAVEGSLGTQPDIFSQRVSQ